MGDITALLPATIVWRHVLARRMAAESGMDPDRATAMTPVTAEEYAARRAAVLDAL